MPRGLYIHIPFCSQKCHYCNFVVTVNQKPDYRERFFEALEAETRAAVSKYGRLSFETVYWGGGTPSLMTEAEMAQLKRHLWERFEILPGAEFTCEVNPGDMSPSKADALKKIGVNRISLGVQAFQDGLLKAAGRLHSAEDTYRTLEILHAGGFENISMDLISGLPGQTLEEFRFNLKEIVRLQASQLSFYDLEIHENTAWGAIYADVISRSKATRDPGISHFVRNDRGPLLTEPQREAFFQEAIDVMTGAGYRQYEISTFAKPGRESRHNLIYWNNDEYLGLGPGAYSYLIGNRYQNAPSVDRYLKKAENGDWVPETVYPLSAEELETEIVLTALRLQEGLTRSRIPVLNPKLTPKFESLTQEGLLLTDDATVRLTSRGRFLVESVFKYLFASHA